MTATIAPIRTAVRKATRPDAPAITSVLAAAFQDDPVFRWLVPDAALRAEVDRAFFAMVVDELAVHDDTWTTTAGITGAALWVPAGRESIPEDRVEGFTNRVLELAGLDTERMLALLELFEQSHPADPHEYLWFLGVAPAAQGRGLGTALMGPVLDRADRSGLPCYLEATSPLNKALYERHGFVARPAIGVAGGPPVWPMARQPA
jgi:GNAT superfamily N-acetyltransferase